MGKCVRLVLNSKSGVQSASAQEIAAQFRQHGCECVTTTLEKSVNMAELAKSEPVEVDFIAAGGDGTVNAVASVLAGTQRRMGVLPVGTLNHFAKDMGLPLELGEAIRVAAGDVCCPVDAAEVNGAVFVNNSSLGLYPGMVLDRERMKKSGWNKWASLVFASAKSFVRFRCLTVKLEVKGEMQRCVTPLIFVGNNEYCMDGLDMGSRERLDRGELSVYLAPGASRMDMLRMTFAALLGRVKHDPVFQEFRVRQFAVDVRVRRLRVSLDGEVRRMPGPLVYKILPGALRVLCAERKSE